MTYIAEKIAAEVVSFITGQTLNRQPEYTVRDDLGAWLFEENLYGQHPYLGNVISLKMPIIGIGAPAAIFLPRVADLLHTDLILPPHYEVANAIGAAIAQVGGECDRIFSLAEMSREEALEQAKQEAVGRAVAAGASESSVEIVDVEEVPLAYLPGNATRIMIKAVGDLEG